MQTRRMGTSDFITSPIGFGSWELSGYYGHFDEAEAIAAIHRAIDLGVTLFDTARIYGFSGDNPEEGGRAEQVLGRALKGRRGEVQIITKGGVTTRPGHASPRDGRYDAVLKDVDASLKTLGTDYVDLFLVHWPDRDVPMEETMSALNNLRDAGKVREVGVSNFPSDLLREARLYAPIVANQVGLNLFDRRWQREVFATAKELGVGIMVYGPLAHGLLTGAISAQTQFDETDWRHNGVFFGQRLLTPENRPANLNVIERLRAVATRKGTSLPLLAIAWVLAQPQVAVTLVGARTPAEIEEDVQALEIAFSDAELAELDQIMLGAKGLVDSVPQ